MNFLKQDIPDLIIIEPTLYEDNRGYFAETFRQDQFEDFLGLKIDFCQENESKSSKGVLRGLHFQLPPKAQSKLVRVVEGDVLDVAVDIRKYSPTFMQHVAVRLSDQNNLQFFIPRGFAHGFVVLSRTATLVYKVDNYYSSDLDQGLAYNSPELNIDWLLPKNEILLSEKDSSLPKSLKEEYCFDYKVNQYGQ